MQFRVPLVDSILAMVRNYSGTLLCDGRHKRGYEAVDEQSEINNDHTQPQKKRRNVQTSLSAKSKHVNRIIDWLGIDGITAIGIYGMGGVGKTSLATQLHTQVLNNDIPSTDSHAVAWVTVKMGFTVYQLQKQIAAAFRLDFEGDKDENRRAAMLYSFLSRTNCILFLDDLWTEFRREDVGIPLSCKLIVISRSLDVCRILHCQKFIKVEPLSEEESWELFHYNIGGYGVSDSEKVSSLKKLVYDESAGLPLAITVLANNMMEVENDALRWMEFSVGHTQMEDMFNQLKLSYDRLNNFKLQRCFLYCALYPKGYGISKEELIHIWIAEGLIDDVPSLQAQYDMGHSILNKLLNSCLLETCEDTSSIKMHDLVRRMALFIAIDCSKVTADVPSKLEFCSKNLHAVSLINSSVSLILSNNALKCVNLSTLLLQHSTLEVIPESLFLKMCALRVLSLSDTFIVSLPSSISALEELQVLDLSSCQRLKQVSSLVKLHKLRFLDLSHTAIDHVPRSLEMLTMLKELNLSSVMKPVKFPRGVLPNLSALKKLSCHVLGIIHELPYLKSLEILDATFDNLFDLSIYVRSQHWRTLECFHLQVGHPVRPKRSYSRGVTLHGCSLSGRGAEQVVLPYDIRELYIDDCSGFGSLSDVIHPGNAYGYKERAEAFASLEIEDCAQLKKLIVEEIGARSSYDGKRVVVNLPQLKQLVN